MVAKADINSQLTSIKNGNVLKQDLDGAVSKAVDAQYINKATLIGNKSGEVVAGFESLETKIDDAGTTALGDAVCRMTEGVPGVGKLFDPETSTLNISLQSFTEAAQNLDSAAADSAGLADELFSLVEPIGGGVATAISGIIQLITGLGSLKTAFSDVGIGGSALDAVKATTDDISSKSKGLLDDVTGALDVVSGGEVSNLTEAVKSGDLTGIVKSASAIASLNPAIAATNVALNVAGVENPSELTNFTGNNSLIPVPGGPLGEVITDIKSVVNQIETGVGQTIGEINKLTAQITSFTSRTGIATGFGLLQDIAEDLTREASSAINRLAFGTEFSDAELSDILGKAISGDPKQRTSAVKEIMKNTKNFSPEMRDIIDSVTEEGSVGQFINEVKSKAEVQGIDPEEIRVFEERTLVVEGDLDKLDTTISGSIVKSAEEFFSEDVNLTELANRYKGSASEFSAFTYIESKEELLAEIAKSTRDISELIVHSTDTYTNANIGCEELHTLHNEEGFDGIQYHFVIRRDGRLQRGVPLDKVTASSDVRGHKTRCIDVALVGGINAPSGTENPEQYASSQSFTRIQMLTLEKVLEAFYSRYHGGQVMGHNDLSENHNDPYFDVIEYAENLFRKKSVYDNLLEDTAFEPADLIQQRPV